MQRVTVRMGDDLVRRLDELASARGLKDRSEALRVAALEATLTPTERQTAPDRDELLRLLGTAARGGSVTAMRTLLDELREPPGGGDNPSEAFIERLARDARERRANGHAAARGR